MRGSQIRTRLSGPQKTSPRFGLPAQGYAESLKQFHPPSLLAIPHQNTPHPTNLGEAPLPPHVAPGPHFHPPLVGPWPRFPDVVPVDAVVPSRHGTPPAFRARIPTARPPITTSSLDFATFPSSANATPAAAATVVDLESFLREGQGLEAGVAGEGVPPGEQS